MFVAKRTFLFDLHRNVLIILLYRTTSDGFTTRLIFILNILRIKTLLKHCVEDQFKYRQNASELSKDIK